VPDVSYAVILTHDAARAAACMRSIAAQEPDAEILLVLNDVDAGMRALAESVEGARIVHDGTDVGAVLGWNLALSAAAAPRVCVMHEDSELRPGCAQRLLDTLHDRPDAAATCPRTRTTDGSPPYFGGIIWADGATSRVNEPARDGGVFPVDYASSACLMLDRRAALGVGGFDERFFPAIYLDASLSCALWSAGRSVLCDPRAESVHATGAMVNPALGARRGMRFRRFLVDRNRARFQQAWAGLLREQVVRADAHDARYPQAAEVAEARERTLARERRARAAAPPAAEGTLSLPADAAAHAGRLRREVEDEFMTLLVEREAVLEAEAAELHGRYAEVHGELQRVHRAYAELWDDRERLRSLLPGGPVEG
jgi:GT2 family glycosyltransferase